MSSDSPAATSAVRIMVCVITDGRRGSLGPLIEGLGSLRVDAGTSVEIVVIDNSPDGRLRHRAEDDGGDGLPVRIHHEPRPGIPMARNAALDLARDENVDWLAFVDDDETVDPGWLSALVAAAHDHDADVVTGPRIPVHAPGTPDWVVRGGFFDRGRKPTGTRLSVCSTSNVLLRPGRLAEAGLRFDERLREVGGSDTDLFMRAATAGIRIVWCDEAIVRAPVAPERASMSWLVRRRLREGTTVGLLTRRGEGLSETVAKRTVRGAAHVALGLAQATIGLLTRRDRLVNGLRHVAFGIGTLAGLAGFAYAEYGRGRRGWRRPDHPAASR